MRPNSQPTPPEAAVRPVFGGVQLVGVQPVAAGSERDGSAAQVGPLEEAHLTPAWSSPEAAGRK